MNAYDLGLQEPEEVAAKRPRQSMQAEKRRHPRRQVSVRCWLEDGRQTIYARVHDLSLGGLSMRVPLPFSLGSEIDVALTFAGTPGGLLVPVRAVARVVWLRVADSGPRMGTRFVAFPDGDEALRGLVER